MVKDTVKVVVKSTVEAQGLHGLILASESDHVRPSDGGSRAHICRPECHAIQWHSESARAGGSRAHVRRPESRAIQWHSESARVTTSRRLCARWAS